MAEITVFANGPYLIDVSGLELIDADGKAIDIPQGSKVALCRCGSSENKPFCDGTHKSVGFDHDPAAC